MIYFLVNNDYHLDLDIKLASQMSGYGLGLIQVPYSLNVIEKSDVFLKIYSFSEKMFLSLFHPFRISKIKREVNKQIHPCTKDILLVHTDLVLLNQYIIQKFYESNAKIYILEDGTATMCYYNMTPTKARLKDKIKTIILRKCYNFKFTDIQKFGVEILPVMEDCIFEGVIVNHGHSIQKNLPLFKLTCNEDKISNVNENGAFFFSQALYFWFASEVDYVKYICDLLSVSIFFTPFYFKFHPSETESVRCTIENYIEENYKNIIIIQENIIAEKIIDKYPVRYAITFKSTAALNLINKGVVPIFLNNLLQNKFPDTSFITFGNFLESINCNTPLSLDEVRPGFQAFPLLENNADRLSIKEILNLD